MTDDIQRALGRIEATQEAIMKMLEKHILEDQAAWLRVSAIESKMSWGLGYVAAAASFIGLAMHMFLKKVNIL